MNYENRLATVASADNFWLEGVARVTYEAESFDQVVQSYSDFIIQGFVNHDFKLEHIRKIVQGASKLDGQATLLVREVMLSPSDVLEADARRLAHHALRSARNVVSSRNGIWQYSRQKQLENNLIV